MVMDGYYPLECGREEEQRGLGAMEGFWLLGVATTTWDVGEERDKEI